MKTEYVTLVNEKDQVIGSEEKINAHRMGILHRAFSIFIFRTQTSIELLLQRRNPKKYHCGNLWTNTCCGHPRPNESVYKAAHRRLKEEMGFVANSLLIKNKFYYTAIFNNGLIENEIDYVLVGFENPERIDFNPEEVSEYKWVSVKMIKEELKHNYETFAPWFSRGLDIAISKNVLCHHCE